MTRCARCIGHAEPCPLCRAGFYVEFDRGDKAEREAPTVFDITRRERREGTW